MIDRRLLAVVPEPELRQSRAIERGIADSVGYLASDAGLRSIAVDTYWPKWDSPWWHMLLLWELGEARQIPAAAVSAMVAGLDALPLHTFPIPQDAPPGIDPFRDISCHCALGCMYQVLAACGVDVDRLLPWIVPWFLGAQMADGGLNCDEAAYRCTDECPSSMVGTVAPFEAMLLGGRTGPGRVFLERGADFLIGRALMRGSETVHNAEERDAAPAWLLPCFPRFYFYDVVRGMDALVRWAEPSGATVPYTAVADVIASLARRYPDGVVRVERQAHASRKTIIPAPGRGSDQRGPASSFPLLQAASAIGEPCAALTRQWTAARRGLLRMLDAGRLI